MPKADQNSTTPEGEPGYLGPGKWCADASAHPDFLSVESRSLKDAEENPPIQINHLVDAASDFESPARSSAIDI